MAKIIEIIGFEDKGKYGLAHVLIDDGTEATVYIGGSVEVFLDKGIVKCFIKKAVDKD